MAAGLTSPAPLPRVFRRSTWARAGALLALLLVPALAAVAVGGRSLLASGLTLLAVLAAGFTLLSAFGDAWELDAQGIAYRNRWARRGLFVPRRIVWAELEAVRVWRGRVLILVPREGPRLILDQVEDFAELRDCCLRLSGLEGSGEPGSSGGS